MNIRFLLIFLIIHSSLLAQTENSGNASYYAKKFQGRKTANGEIFSNSDYSAAHRSLPFDTYLNIVNEENGYNVIVRVNDRGPYTKNRVIDLSEAAARRLGGYHHGLIKIKFDPIDIIQLTPELEKAFESPVVDCLGNEATLSGYSLSLWSTFDLIHALYIANDLYLKENISQVLVCTKKNKSEKKYHVVITGYNSKQLAAQAKEYYEKKGFMNVSFFK